MDVVEILLDEVWLSDGRDDAQPATAPWTQLDVDVEHALEPLSPGKGGEGWSGDVPV